jgi:hypothetical protein
VLIGTGTAPTCVPPHLRLRESNARLHVTLFIDAIRERAPAHAREAPGAPVHTATRHEEDDNEEWQHDPDRRPHLTRQQRDAERRAAAQNA